MAKEVIPPNPVPVKVKENNVEDLFCASYLNYSKDSYSETSKELIEYLESKYDGIGFGGTTRTFFAENEKLEDVYNSIIDANISGICKDTFDKHIILKQLDRAVEIFVILY